MSFGLKVWDGNGGEVVEITTRLPRLVGIYPFQFTSNNYTQYIPLPVIGGSGQVFGVCSGTALSAWAWAEYSEGQIIMRRRVVFPGNDAPLSGTVLVFQL